MLPVLIKHPLNRVERYDPFRLFRDFFDDVSSDDIIHTPRFGSLDVYEDEKSLYVEAELPGFKQDQIDLTLEDNTLQITATREEKTERKDSNYYLAERHEGKWARTVRLPVAVQNDKVQATYKDGVLKIELEKAEQARSHKIKIG